MSKNQFNLIKKCQIYFLINNLVIVNYGIARIYKLPAFIYIDEAIEEERKTELRKLFKPSGNDAASTSNNHLNFITRYFIDEFCILLDFQNTSDINLSTIRTYSSGSDSRNWLTNEMRQRIGRNDERGIGILFRVILQLVILPMTSFACIGMQMII